MDSNVGMGVVPCRKGCRCDDCCIEQLEAQVRDLSASPEAMTVRYMAAANENAELQARLDAVEKLPRIKLWTHCNTYATQIEVVRADDLDKTLKGGNG